jgi:hypothetical protein
MQKPPLDPDVVDIASHAVLTEEHLITYLRLLDADAESTDWREAARITSWAAEIERPLLNS